MSSLTMEPRSPRLAVLLTCAIWLVGVVVVVADEYPVLTVTTGGLGNTLLRGGGHRWDDRAQVYLQLYTSDLAVTADGMVYCATTWEEGHRAAGIYRDGDALTDVPTFGTTAGACVAVNDRWVVYGQNGKLAVSSRRPGQTWEVSSSHHQEIAGAAQVTGLALAGDQVFCVDALGAVRSWDLNKRVVDPTVRFRVPGASQLRCDKRGNLWFLVPSVWAGHRPLEVSVSGEAANGHPVEHVLRNDGEQVFWQGAGGSPALTVDLGKAQPIHQLRFYGAGFNTATVGAVLLGAADPAGPWTELQRIERECAWWPQTVLTLDGRSWRCLRLANDKPMGLRGLTVHQALPVTPGAVRGFSPEGRPLAELPGTTQAIAIAYDAAGDRLLVSIDDAMQQIHAFTGLDRQPRRDPTWMKGGVFGEIGGLPGANGVPGDRRFDTARGIGVDGTGSLMVFSVGGAGTSQSRLESYSPDGALRWRMSGLAFLDAVETDPGATSSAWSANWRYVRDREGREGDGWRAVGSTLDRWRFPEDGRLNGLSHVLGVRRIAGRPFLFVTTQYSDQVALYRFDRAHGEIAIPCGYISGKPTGTTWPPHQPAGSTLRLWVDRDGDGRFQKGEWQNGETLVMHYFTVDTNGGLWWIDERAKGIRHLAPESQLDAHGAPVYLLANARLLPVPAAFAGEGGVLRGLEVDPNGSSLFVFGFTKELPSTIGHNHPGGRLVVRLDLSGTEPRETHRRELPHDVEWTPGAPHDQTYASSIAGDFLFVGYEQRMDVLVLNHRDLTPVGRIHIGPQSQTPIFDGPSELIAARDGSSYDLFTAQYTGNATTHVRWTPGRSGLPSPTLLVARRAEKGVELTWGEVAGATGYVVERRILGSLGWEPWLPAATTRTAAWFDPKPATAGGYRVRASGTGEALSDWSGTFWLR
jgi:hypothetical protein